MRKALPKGLVKRNISIPRSEVAMVDSLQVALEASSDSEVTRQALRHLEQLVEDEKHGVKLKVVNGTSGQILSSDRFRDRPEGVDYLRRRSLILHGPSDKRLERLRVAMGAKDSSEVVRCALRFYDKIVTSSLHGAQFFAVFPSGEEFRGRFSSCAPAASGETKPAHQPKPPGRARPGGFSSESEPAQAIASTRSR